MRRRFRKNWDTFLIDQLYACPTEKAVISTYPQGYVRPNFVSHEIQNT